MMSLYVCIQCSKYREGVGYVHSIYYLICVSFLFFPLSEINLGEIFTISLRVCMRTVLRITWKCRLCTLNMLVDKWRFFFPLSKINLGKSLCAAQSVYYIAKISLDITNVDPGVILSSSSEKLGKILFLRWVYHLCSGIEVVNLCACASVLDIAKISAMYTRYTICWSVAILFFLIRKVRKNLYDESMYAQSLLDITKISAMPLDSPYVDQCPYDIKP